MPALPQWTIASVTPGADDSSIVTINPLSQQVQTAAPGSIVNFQTNFSATQSLTETSRLDLYLVNASGATVAHVANSFNNGAVVLPSTQWSGPISVQNLMTVPALADGTYYVMATLTGSKGILALTAGPGVVHDQAYRYYVGVLDVSASGTPSASLGFATSTGPSLAGYHLTFDDEFQKLSISDSRVYDGSNWYTHNEACCMSTTDGAATAMVGLSDPQDPYSLIPGGGLDIRLQEVNKRWTSGVMTSVDNTGKGFSQEYGYFEMKAKLPSGIDTWPAFWMLDEASKTGVKTSHGEIDIMEYIANPSFINHFSTTLHDWTAGTTAARGSVSVEPVPSDGNYHTYGMLWTPQTMSFYYDGVLTFQTPTPSVMHQPYYMLADLGIGSGWPTNATPPINDMQIAYIRAYSNTASTSSATVASTSSQTASAAEAGQTLDQMANILQQVLRYLGVSN